MIHTQDSIQQIPRLTSNLLVEAMSVRAVPRSRSDKSNQGPNHHHRFAGSTGASLLRLKEPVKETQKRVLSIDKENLGIASSDCINFGDML